MSKKTTNLIYEKQLAQALMTDSVPVLFADDDIASAISLLESRLIESINYLYIIDESRVLKGAISIKEIFAREKNTKLKTLINTKLVSVSPEAGAEEVANLALKHNIKSVPVVNNKGELMGVVLSDTILDIAYRELQDDLSRLAGLQTPETIHGVDSLSVSASLKNRFPWLIVGMLGGFIMSKTITSFETILAANVIIASFIPLLVYMASAVQTQIGFFIVRDLAFNPHINFWAYAWRQLKVVFLIGAGISILLAVCAYLFYQDLIIVAILAIAMFLAILSSIVTGVFIPFIFQRLKFDPASASGPIATILQDLISIIIYLLVAQSLL